MNLSPIRHALPALPRLTVVAASAVAVVGLSACGGTGITKARLERNLPEVFANQYVQQAKILGHKGIAVQSLHPRATCDKGGPKVADNGPGADWICQMSWKDPNVPLPDGFGKFELNVHSNDCYTAGGPSKLVGLITITDTHGNDVPNPVFEFDSCFDPKSSNAPTGVSFPQPSTTGTTAAPAPTPAGLRLPTGTVTLDRQGRIATMLMCSGGNSGCAGTLSATRGARLLGTTTYAVAAGTNATVHVRLAGGRPVSAGGITLAAKAVIGNAPPSPARVTLKG
ncbi:MAG: hypothetical protein JWO02_1919 [Solirubrobacterales bacterium]|nr:hypothetical protein [Solirubrobacterales bacterium]